MPTATLLIEIVLIGLFANLNLLLLFSLFVPLGPWLTQVAQSLGAQEGVATLALFGVALASYVLGVIVNVSVSNLFDPIDDHIREEVFNAQAQTALQKADPWINEEQRKTSEIYHYIRYRLYDHGQSVKEQLDQHRSEIRILRATAVNSYWLMVMLLYPPPSYVVGKLYGWVALILLTAMAVLIAWSLPVLQPAIIKKWKEENKEQVFRLYQRIFWGAFVPPWVLALLASRESRWWVSGVIAGAVALVSFALWTKQQKRFYQALFHGFRALAVKR